MRGSIYTQKTDSSDKTKVARLFHPVICAKNTEKVVEKITGDDEENFEQVIRKSFKGVHVLFQSTSLFNISTDNALNRFKPPDMIREIGQFGNRRYWGIEKSNMCQFYLGTYS